MKEFVNVEIGCKVDNNNSFDHERNVVSSCGCKFKINEDEVYSIISTDCFSEEVIEFYVICPECGYFNKLDEEMLPLEVKEKAILRNREEPFQYRKNNLKSELIYLDRISRPLILKRGR